MWWGSSGSGWGWILGVLAVVVCVAMMVGMMRHGASGRMRQTSNRGEDVPERILAQRLASGEIDVEEFGRLRDALQGTRNSTADAADTGRVERHSPTA
jgi:putative membrane protein